MVKQTLLAGAVALTLVLQTGAIAQTPPGTTSASQQVQRLAPQLVVFAGSDVNFQNLVNGLSQGLSVTITTLTADGLLQTVTFTPASPMSIVDIARTLETARQQLIARGVANPTAEQIGTVLAGGNLPTASGAVPVSGLLPTLTQGGINASLGASRRPAAAAVGTTNPSSNLTVDVRPAAPQLVGSGTTSASAGVGTTSAIPQPGTVLPPRFTSDSTRIGNTSDPLLPSNALPPTLNPSTGVSNGGPSPAVQLQGRR